MYWFIPFDHTEQFLLEVGFEKGNAALKAHVLDTKETWSVLGALAAGVMAALFPFASTIELEERTIVDQLRASLRLLRLALHCSDQSSLAQCCASTHLLAAR